MSFQQSYYPNYFSLDDILATQERMPCKFLEAVPRLGFLNPSSETEDLAAGTKLELPFWLVESLGNMRTLVEIDLPRMYKDAYQEILKADPCTVDLHKLAMYFYDLGSYVAKYDSQGKVNDILIQTFKIRFRQVIDLADNSGSDLSSGQHLDELERYLFRLGHRARTQLNEWLMQSSTAITTADMIKNHKKRKHTEINAN